VHSFTEELANLPLIRGLQVEFRAMLFVPSQLPFELGANMFDENSKNMRLYVRRVFINDNFQVTR
jgi:heat shock protein beta